MSAPKIEISAQDKEAIRKGVELGKKISLITYVLGDIGEIKLKYLLDCILEKYNRSDLLELFYTAAKELIANSTKAAIKRMIFDEMGLNIKEEIDYRKGMERFKSYLNERKFPAYRSKMKENNYFIKITITHDPNKMALYVANNFSLIPVEEERVREKFENAKKYDNLFEFFMAHGDNTEGAGMGITMVEILLSQSGYDRKNFIIFSSNRANLTLAKMEVPLIEGTQLPLPFGDKQLISTDMTLPEMMGVYK
ncbi:hypothetical protein [Leptospira sp. GIMC2001]|uniref:hypothetical protein n=1 Tax=Leptospira sp. GIMC2001 TaxID=1513297 RepID=UPI002349D0C3|nr:hypothetical protein [Leptospira sp. GIMC2001]WCL49317.1 hypothetical protein O4O04_18815 [Leptospira sp. GIMC2001]